MRNARIKANPPRQNGDAFGCTMRANDEETGVEFVVEVTVTGDGDVFVKSGPYNGSKTEINLGGLARP